MKIKYQGEYYNVKIVTVLKIWSYRALLFGFRIKHFGARLKKYLVKHQYWLLILFGIVYFCISLFLNVREPEYFSQLLERTLIESKNIIFFTLFVPILISFIAEENDRKRKLNKRYRAWYCVDVQINGILGVLFQDNEEYLSLSVYTNNEKIKGMVEAKKAMLKMNDFKLLEIVSKINLILYNSWDFDIEPEEINSLQECCMKIDRMIENNFFSTENDIEELCDALSSLIIDLRKLDFLLGKQWIKDTKYNKLIIRLIEKEDPQIVSSRSYKRYIMQS